jgi:GH15 family glucan-1,4-alpha-glucosidase
MLTASGPSPIEAYGLIGDGRSAALVSRDGAVEWLCWPRFDSPACFAALLGGPEQGAWRIAPERPAAPPRRRYRDDTLLLETHFSTADGVVVVIDAMPPEAPHPTLVRLVEGREGAVAMRVAIAPRFGYGAEMPAMSRLADGSGIRAAAGADGVVLRSPVPLEITEGVASARFTVGAGETVAFVLSHAPDGATPPPLDAGAAVADSARRWAEWTRRCAYRGPYEGAVRRSLLTLKALVYRPTGGIVAAPTTSLPEALGGGRNWDYRFCWLRDSSLTLLALLRAGYAEEAQAWRGWLRRTLDGRPERMQIMYGLGGERDLTERQADWLPGYQGARPVRLGNAAHDQLQLDVFGEVADALHTLRAARADDPSEGWDVERGLIEHLETIRQQPDEGIWEVRGGRRRFTFSAVMAWVALDRAIRSAETFSLPAPLDRWRGVRAAIHAEVCGAGFDVARGSFVQYFGGQALDASLLLIPAVGFLPADDARVRGTVAAIERELLVDGLVRRYDTASGTDGLPPGEGAFLACSFWLADAYAMQGRLAEATALFERLLALRNDLGLLAEEYDPVTRRQLGNFPQGFSHAALLGTAFRLRQGEGSALDPLGP